MLYLDKNIKPILALLYCAIFVVLLSQFLDLIIDDSYITFQYAKNFALYGKPWYNLDPEFQGNGQTSLLWFWLLSALYYLGIKPEDSFYLINVFLGFFLICKLVFSMDFKSKNLWKTCFNIVLLCFFTYWLALNSSHGLETVLAAAILYLFLKDWKKNQNFYAILLPLVRPEFAVFAVFWILDSPIFSKNFFKRIVISVLGIAIFLGFYFAFFDYYLPLSFVLKNSVTFSFAALKVFVGYLVLFSPVIFYFIKSKKFIKIAPFLLLLFYYTFFVHSYSSGIYIRYLFPLFIYFFFIKIEKSFVQNFLLAISTLRMLDLGINFYENRQYNVINCNQGFARSYGEILKILKKSDKILILDAGYTAYFSEATCYDGYGLNDATLIKAWKSRDAKNYKTYVDRKKINYIALSSKKTDTFVPEGNLQEFIYKSLVLKDKKIVKVYPFYDGSCLFLFDY